MDSGTAASTVSAAELVETSQPTRGRARRLKSEGSESARDALLRVMVKTIDEHGEPGVRLEKVLHEANSSVSSMYHHFGNLAGLIEAAQIVRFRRTQQMDLEFFRDGLKEVSTLSEFRELVVTGMSRAFHADRRITRAQRVNVLGRSYQNPHYAEQLRELQREANVALIDALVLAQARDLIPAHVDVELAAAWWATMTSGRYFVELLDDPSLEERWNGLAKQFVFTILEIAE